MALLPLGAKNSKKVTTNPSHVQCQKKKKTVQRDDEKPAPPPPPPWGTTLRSFFSCKYHQTVTVGGERIKRPTRIGWSGALCSLRESSKVMQRPEPNSPESFKDGAAATSSIAHSNSSNRSSHSSASASTTAAAAAAAAAATSSSSSSSSLGSGSGHLRRFSGGCYECHTAVDPITGVSRVPSFRRSSVFSCSVCGEIFTKCETLELHQALKHAVSELCPEDNSRNIVEIIFLSSWLKKEAPVCKIDRILKVHNTQKTIARFEGYRDSIKSGANHLATKKHARCVADGNELLRFHCAPIGCSLGLDGSTNLCASSSPECSVCSIIRDGFKPDALGRIRTMETSGGAHDVAGVSSCGRERAMLVCRVIAGRVNKNQERGSEEYDSVAGSTGTYSNLDELVVFDPRAILPCFVVIYRRF